MDKFAIYAAGLFDGEGYVRLATYTNKTRPTNQTRYQVFAGINMCDPRPLHPLHDRFGGSLHCVRSYNIRNPKHRTLFGWNISSKKAYPFFKAIYPYLIVKRDEVALAIEYQERIKTMHGRQISASITGDTAVVEEIMSYKRHVASELSRLKRLRFDPLSFKSPSSVKCL